MENNHRYLALNILLWQVHLEIIKPYKNFYNEAKFLNNETLFQVQQNLKLVFKLY